eukprot:354173-Chlamydomonas_euryale.AAC.7
MSVLPAKQVVGRSCSVCAGMRQLPPSHACFALTIAVLLAVLDFARLHALHTDINPSRFRSLYSATLTLAGQTSGAIQDCCKRVDVVWDLSCFPTAPKPAHWSCRDNPPSITQEVEWKLLPCLRGGCDLAALKPHPENIKADVVTPIVGGVPATGAVCIRNRCCPEQTKHDASDSALLSVLTLNLNISKSTAVCLFFVKLPQHGINAVKLRHTRLDFVAHLPPKKAITAAEATTSTTSATAASTTAPHLHHSVTLELPGRLERRQELLALVHLARDRGKQPLQLVPRRQRREAAATGRAAHAAVPRGSLELLGGRLWHRPSVPHVVCEPVLFRIVQQRACPQRTGVEVVRVTSVTSTTPVTSGWQAAWSRIRGPRKLGGLGRRRDPVVLHVQ